MKDQFDRLMQNAPPWLTPEMVMIGGGVLIALLVLWIIARIFRRRPDEARYDDPGEAHFVDHDLPPTRPITPPPVTPAPPPVMDEPPFVPPAPMPAEPEPEVYEAPAAVKPAAPAPVVEPAPVAAPVAPVAVELPAEPQPVDETPEPASLADEPVAAAAPMEASPASLAADLAEPEPAREPEPPTPEPTPPAPEPAAPEPAPPPTPAADDLTRMKGVGPRLAERLNSIGVTSFAQIASLSAADVEALDARLGDFQGRIIKDRWIEQASFLAAGDISGFEDKFGKL